MFGRLTIVNLKRESSAVRNFTPITFSVSARKRIKPKGHKTHKTKLKHQLKIKALERYQS